MKLELLIKCPDRRSAIPMVRVFIMAHIYKITSPSKKIYIGSTIDIKNRIRHYRTLHCKTQLKLYNSLKKYGWVNHKFEVITECDQSEMFKLEAYYGNLFDVLGKHGLNLKIPKHGVAFKNISDETKHRMSEASKGNLNCLGRKLSDETKRKISEAVSVSNLGRKASDEAKRNMSEAQKGKKHSDETKRKIGEAGKGRKHSDETKRNMSEARKGNTYRLGKRKKTQQLEIYD